MAHFRKHVRSYTLPDNPSAKSIDIHRPSDSYPALPYQPPFSRPPSGPLDALGLKARIGYGDNLRKNREITPRTMQFLNWWKERCSALMKAAPFGRKKMVKEVEILDGIMQSRYDAIHAREWLCNAILELFNAMAEVRMKAEYGDYLAYACEALKTERMNDLLWKIQKLDWQAVAERVKKEETTLAEEKSRRLAPSPTPFLDDIQKAAQRLGYEESMVRYQILAYAERNNFCHSGIKAMIHHGDFEDLAKRIVEDLRSLQLIFQGQPHEQIKMRSLIKIVEREWFYQLWIDETRKERPVKFLLSEKGSQKMMSLAPPRG